MEDFKFNIPQAIKDKVYYKTIRAGGLVLSEGQTGDKVCFLIRGQVKIYTTGLQGQRLLQNIIAAPNAFGMVEMFDALPNVCTVEAYTDVDLLVVNRPDYLWWLSHDPAFALDMLKRVSKIAYMQIERQTITVMYPLKYRFLSLLIESYDQKPSDVFRYDKQILSERLATTTRHLNRTIQACVDQGFLLYDEGKIQVVDWEALKKYKDGE